MYVIARSHLTGVLVGDSAKSFLILVLPDHLDAFAPLIPKLTMPTFKCVHYEPLISN